MRKLTSIYLTPEEDEALRAYCDKHGCTPHSVIKAGLHWILEEIARALDFLSYRKLLKNILSRALI